MDFNINMDTDVNVNAEKNLNVNLSQRKCPLCQAMMTIKHCDGDQLTFECIPCGYSEIYTFQSEEEAQYYLEEAKFELFSKLRRGFVDWQTTDWNALSKDFIEFINRHPYLEDDIQIQMGTIACMTKGFHHMEREKYKQCTRLFKIVDKMYDQRLRILRVQEKNPAFLDSMEDYKLSRQKYVKLRNEFLQTKLMYRTFWFALKVFFK